MNDIKKTFAIKNEKGKIVIINGTCCSETLCRNHGCGFPECATFSGEEFDTVEDAQRKYPYLEIV